jgi:hypothetical protein
MAGRTLEFRSAVGATVDMDGKQFLSPFLLPPSLPLHPHFDDSTVNLQYASSGEEEENRFSKLITFSSTSLFASV